MVSANKKLFEFYRTDVSRPYRVEVFDHFVRDFEKKLNQPWLGEPGVITLKEIDSAFSLLSTLMLEL